MILATATAAGVAADHDDDRHHDDDDGGGADDDNDEWRGWGEVGEHLRVRKCPNNIALMLVMSEAVINALAGTQATTVG